LWRRAGIAGKEKEGRRAQNHEKGTLGATAEGMKNKDMGERQSVRVLQSCSKSRSLLDSVSIGLLAEPSELSLSPSLSNTPHNFHRFHFSCQG